MEKTLLALRESGILIETDYLLSSHSAFHIGGPARAAAFPRNTEQMLLLLSTLKAAGIAFRVIGNATNVVFSDRGYDGVILFTARMKGEECSGDLLTLEAGVSMRRAAMLAKERGLSGLEFAYGIPGTLGGGVFMNAGAYGQEICDVCVRSEYYDVEKGILASLTGEEQGFSTRFSSYQKHPERVILRAELLLKPGDSEKIASLMEEQQNKRRSSQPLEYPNAGSVFKRPQGDYAARLIDVCGLKGLRVGGAEVSQKHAGFIVNRGGATARDVKDLTCLVRERVFAQTGVLLECEIEFIE